MSRGYGLWNEEIAGSGTPCFSTLAAETTAPPLLVSAMGQTQPQPTSAVINIVYAVRYPVKSSKMPKSTAIAIGVGSAVAAILLIAIILLGCCFVLKRNRKNAAAVPPAAPVLAYPVGYEKTGVMAATTPADDNTWKQNGPPAANSQFQQALHQYPQPPQQFSQAPQQYQQPYQQFPQTAPQQVSQYPQMPYPAMQQPMAGQEAQIQPGQEYSPFPQAASPPVYPSAEQGPEQQAKSVSPLQEPQELHDPNWEGRRELHGVAH